MQIIKLSPMFLSQAETKAEVQNGHRHKLSQTSAHTIHTRTHTHKKSDSEWDASDGFLQVYMTA